MKKILYIAAIVAIIMSSSGSAVFAVSYVDSVTEAESRFEGLTNREINTILMDEMMSEIKRAGINIYDFDEEELKVQKLAKETGLNRNQVSSLMGMGYLEDEIVTMTLDEVDNILTKDKGYDYMEYYYNKIAPRPFDEYKDKFPNDYFSVVKLFPNSRSYSYQCLICDPTGILLLDNSIDWEHYSATGGYSGDGCFHEDSGITSDSILSTACYRAKLIAMKMFDRDSSSGLGYDYYLFGENLGVVGKEDYTHEGIDMYRYDGAPVYSPILGKVLRKTVNSYYGTTLYIGERILKSGGTYGYGTFSINVQHLDNNTTTPSVNDIVEGGE